MAEMTHTSLSKADKFVLFFIQERMCFPSPSAHLVDIGLVDDEEDALGLADADARHARHRLQAQLREQLARLKLIIPQILLKKSFIQFTNKKTNI